jgi:hypothetical protein
MTARSGCAISPADQPDIGKIHKPADMANGILPRETDKLQIFPDRLPQSM